MASTAILAALALAPPAAAEDAPIHLHFATYDSGVHFLDLEAFIAIRPAAYQLQVSYSLTGVIGSMVHASSTTTVDGRFQDGAAAPRQLRSSGQFRGHPGVTQIDWRDGNPVITQMIPPLEPERMPVPASEQAHTIDPLSAIATLLHRLDQTGRCEGTATTFDGRRLSEITTHTVGEETLKPAERSSFQGPALRCDFEGRQTGGFVKDADQAAARRPHLGSAWVARVSPGGPFIPVRVVFQTPVFGPATMYLTAVD